MFFRIAIVFAFALSPALAAPEGFTLQQVMKAPFASELTVSPKGDCVAWLVDAEGRRNIWTAAAPDWKGRQVTAFSDDDGQDIAELAWAPDDETLFFARGGDFENGRENPNPAVALKRPGQDVWSVGVHGGAAKKLAEGHAPSIRSSAARVWFLRKGNVFSMNSDGSDVRSEIEVQGSAEDLTWSPNGDHLAFTNRRSGHSFIAVYDASAKSLHFLDPSVDTDQSPVWSPDGSQIAFLRTPASTANTEFTPQREGYPWSIRISDADGSGVREVFRALPGPGSVFHETVADKQILWTPGNNLVFPWEHTGWLHLYRIPAAGGTPIDLTPGEGEVEHVSISANRQLVLLSSNIGDIDRRHIWTVAPDTQSKASQAVKDEDIEWMPQGVSGNGIAMLCSSYNRSAHAEVFAGGQRRDMAPLLVPEDFPSKQLVKPEPVMVTASDGLVLHGQLFRPAGGGKHPALVFFHGGSRRQMLLGFHYMYYYSNAYAMNQYLASRGYIVLAVNYRSGIGYGLNFREAIQYGAAGASEYNDVQGAGLYLKSRDDVDPQAIGSWGGSYGGYLTALALARSSDLFAAGVDFHGVHDWNLEITNWESTYDPRAHADAARIAFESSPIAAVSTWRSPVLLIHGDDDRNVPFQETIQLVEALRKQHVDFEELIFPNEIHDFLLWRDWVRAYQAEADFFARKLPAK